MNRVQICARLILVWLDKEVRVVQWGASGCILGIAIMAMALFGCNKATNSEGSFRTFQIQVDSLTIASTFAVSDTMKIQFHATIGPNGCYEFSHIDTVRIGLEYRISVWGKEYTDNRFCPDVVTLLRHTLEVYPLSFGSWIILVDQPNGSILRKETVVR